jgi:hypothetical protein
VGATSKCGGGLTSSAGEAERSLQMRLQCCHETAECFRAAPAPPVPANTVRWTRVDTGTSQNESWTLVAANDTGSGQAVCRQHGARLGAFTRCGSRASRCAFCDRFLPSIDMRGRWLRAARDGATNSSQQYVKALKQLMQTTVAKQHLLTPLSCVNEEPPMVLWSGLTWTPGDAGWSFVDPPLRNPNVKPLH